MRTRSGSGTEVLLDTNYLVGYHRATDPQHPRAELIDEVLERKGAVPCVLDCVYSEIIAVLARAYAEENELEKFVPIAARLEEKYWPNLIWVTYVGEGLLRRAIDICKEAAETSNVGISPHDAMILLFAQEKGIKYIVSFDEQLEKVRTVEGRKVRAKIITDKNVSELKG